MLFIIENDCGGPIIMNKESKTTAKAGTVPGQGKATLKEVRAGLYREMYHNYSVAQSLSGNVPGDGLLTDPPEEAVKAYFLQAYTQFGKGILRTEYYGQALKSDLALFRQLREADTIQSVYHALDLLSEAIQSRNIKRIYEACETYSKLFSRFLYEGSLEKKVLKQIIPDSVYEEILARGRQAHLESQKTIEGGVKNHFSQA
jgi:hypothetical protein